MADNTRTSLWIAGAAVVSGLIAWAFSFSGYVFAGTMLQASLPGWLSPTLQRGSLLTWEGAGLLVAFLLALLCVRRWSAPSQLWLGALAASLLLAPRQLVGLAILARIHATPEAWHDVLYADPFLDPFAALLALLGLPAVVALACWIASRRRAGEAAATEAAPATHA